MQKHVMTPVFALLVAFLALDVLSIVAPFFTFRFTENPWGSPERMSFLAKSMASALAFGFVAAVAAERKNRSPWAFLAGHASFWLALVLALTGFDTKEPRGAPLAVVLAGFAGCILVLWFTRTPRPEPPPVRGLLRGLCMLTGRCGNIWFGITLMGAIAISVGAGTILESMYTARAAQHYVYRAAWFGAIFFTGGLSMLSATFRKWPFRLEQAGWLTVHTGLTLVVIGSMMSFLTTVEGEVQIEEGQKVDGFQLSTRTRLVVYEKVRGAHGKAGIEPLIESISDFDLNPADREPKRRYVADAAPIAVTVDRFYGTGVRKPVWHDDGGAPRAGVVLDVFEGDSRKPTTLFLDELESPDIDLDLHGMKIPVGIARAFPRQYDALVREQAPKDHGKIVVRSREGAVLLEMPVFVPAGAETRPMGALVPLQDVAKIPGTDIEVRLLGYADGAVAGRGGRLADRNPGNPVKPAVTLVLSGKDGEDARNLFAWFSDPLPPPEQMPPGRYSYDVRFEYEPRIELAGPQLFMVAVGESLRYVWVSSDGGRSIGTAAPGEPLALPMRFVRAVPRAVYANLRVEEQFEFDGYEPKQPVIEVTPSWDGKELPPLWVPLGSARDFGADGRQFTVTWRATTRPLGFSLQLHDFHRDFHPGSEQPSSFESYLNLVHPAKFPDGADIKIDMNHPLRMDGWRLYQARYGNDRTTILQVNRDPGLAIIYPACSVVFLGLIVVLFMKKTLALQRKKLERDGASPRRHVAHALGAVLAVGAGPALFAGWVMLDLPLAGWPAFAFGLLLVIICPIMVVAWFMGPLSKRLTRALAGSRS